MIRAAENAKSFKKAGNLRNPKNWLDRFSELLPEEWAFDPLEDNVDKKPNSASAWFLLGEAEQARGYFRDALTSFGKAVELKPDYAETLSHSAEPRLALKEQSVRASITRNVKLASEKVGNVRKNRTKRKK